MADVDDADRWLHELIVDDAARHRSVREDLRRLAAEATTLLDTVAAVAATGRQVVVHTAGTSRTGLVTGIGADLVEVVTDDGWLLIASPAIDAVETGPRTERPSPRDRSGPDLRERLRLIQGEGRAVTLTCRNGTVLAGRLDAVGQDVVVLDRRPRRPPAYVSLVSLALVSG